MLQPQDFIHKKYKNLSLDDVDEWQRQVKGWDRKEMLKWHDGTKLGENKPNLIWTSIRQF